jgi:hypothetical protein
MGTLMTHSHTGPELCEVQSEGEVSDILQHDLPTSTLHTFLHTGRHFESAWRTGRRNKVCPFHVQVQTLQPGHTYPFRVFSMGAT